MGTILTTREKGDVTILDIKGKLTLAEGFNDFREKVRELVEAGSKRILLNMAEVSYIDSYGIGELAISYTIIARAGGDMKLLNLGKHVQYLLQITLLCRVFETYGDEDSAIRSFSRARPPHPQVADPFEPGSEFYWD